MAPFNPDVKDVQPVNPIGWSKSAEVPSSFASGLSEALKGIGNVIQSTAKAGVDIIEDIAKKDTRDTIEPVRDDYISQLAGEDFRQKLGLTTQTGNSTDSAEAEASGISAPADLKQELKSLSILPDARANGKISESNYYARLMSAASDLRSRYPVGFRDYIDKEISKITGVDPANAYMHSLIGDINANQTNAQALKTKSLGVIQEVLGLDPTGASEAWRRVSSGAWSPDQGIAYAAPFLAIKAQHEVAMQRNAEEKATADMQKTRTLMDFSKMVASTAYEQINASFKMQGVDTPEKLTDVIQDYRSGRRKMDAQQAFDYGDRAIAMGQAFVTSMQKALYSDPRVYGILQKEGLDAINENAKIFTQMADQFYNQDTGAAAESMRRLKGIQSDTTYKVWIQNPTATAVFAMGKAIKDSWGETAAAQYEQRVVQKDLDSVVNTYLDKVISDISTPDKPGVIKEVKNLDEALARGVNAQQVYNKPLPGYFKGIQDLVDGEHYSLLDPTTPKGTKNEIAFRLFNQFNRDALRRIETDIRDPKTGQLLTGQESWFKRWTSPDVIQVVNRDLRPEVRDMYYDWVSQNYDSLFGRAIKDLGSMNISGAYKVSYDNVNYPPKLVVDTAQTDPTGAFRNVRLKVANQNPVQDTVARINKGIEGLANIYRGQNLSAEDIDARIFKSLNLQLNAKGQLPPINNIPAKFEQAVRAQADAAEEERKAKEAKKAETTKKYGGQ